MKLTLSDRMQTLSPSLTIAISTLARELKAEGKDILSFSAGEPDFGTPKRIKDEAIKAINEGFTQYTAVPGIPKLLKAVATKLERDNNLEYAPSDIIVSNGAKHSLFNLFQAVINPGDEVIIPSPYWVTYPELVKYAFGVPVIIETDDTNKFKITPKQLKNAITSKTKMLVLTSPSNPTGSVYTKEELKEISEVLKDTNILVASDEMYEKLIYGVDFTATASISNDMYQRTVTINGLSKSVAMTGWRFGYLASPNKKLIATINKLQSQSTSNINSITQKAAIPALLGEVDEEITQMKKAFKKRAEEAVKLFNEIDGLSVIKPQGAFYLFVNIKDITEKSIVFCEELLKETGVAVVPGIGFGSEGYFRFSFATDIITIREGIRRIEKFIKSKYTPLKKN
ncbi:MAG: pyridoxal phosphate-dependent aminotransferase [Sulfurovum sp.]|nr:pyridoxal phosphate-dependent aminotransferase [Sulfurovum sp.]MCB4744283.1 pyridoxal phosphate-dependent aminotransferase [Sulfurovum sp.]MCB4745835.1 pyridoxal phosphate-dependent aminotransferase [Sulfurovum sp.]MCB4748667.1 pyridoxal phosphate-dependent aminotransferase [Sulfurovum sp.]MCB4750887.1 pyridoxal phosphate-dependent aminotransferase [Sulfurovum sp.]